MSPQDITTKNFKKEAIAFCDAFTRGGATGAGVSMIILNPKPFEEATMKQMASEGGVENRTCPNDADILLKTGMENIWAGLNRVKSSFSQVQPLNKILEKTYAFLTKGKELQNNLETNTK